MNIYGVGLMGVPGVLIGFNDNVAWTHTFSSGQRFTFYSLPLVAGSPTRYYYGTEQRDMTARAITFQVLQPDGTLKDVTRTAYSSHYGPIISLPGLGWTDQLAISYRDANLDNTQFIAQFHGMNRATSLADFQAAFARYQGIPWVNTMATDREGHTWYTDACPTPNLTAGAIQRWQQKLQAADPLTGFFFKNLGGVLLDGSNPDNEWVVEAGARSPGLVPFPRVPQLSRNDFVFNANDSYWLANPAAPLTDYSPMHGLANVPQSPRTRMNATMLTEVREGGASGPDGRFTLDELRAAIYSDRALTVELLRDAVVQRCTGHSTGTVNGQSVDITQACALLAGWNGRYDVDSVGAIVWREFLGTFTDDQLTNAGMLFSVPFSPSAPIATPNTLAPAPDSGEDPVLTKLATAVVTLGKAGVPVNATLGSVQYSPHGGTRFPLHGGQGREGTANVVSYTTLKSTVDPMTPRGTVVDSRTGLSDQGYVVNNGTSFLMTFAFTDSGVDASAVLTYGQTEDANSPHFNEQLDLFSRKQWRKILFTPEDVAADPALTVSKPVGD
jgi:acyl-homoserine-lactone acylase